MCFLVVDNISLILRLICKKRLCILCAVRECTSKVQMFSVVFVFREVSISTSCKKA